MGEEGLEGRGGSGISTGFYNGSPARPKGREGGYGTEANTCIAAAVDCFESAQSPVRT